MRVLRALPWSLLLVAFVFALATWSALPDAIPMRINSRGEAANLVAKGFWPWFGLPIVALVTHLLLYGIGRIAPDHPELFNHPEKERFLKIPREFQAPVIAELRGMMDVVSVGVVVTILVVQWLLWRVATGHVAQGALTFALIAAALILPAVLLFLSRVNRAVDQAERTWREAEGRLSR